MECARVSMEENVGLEFRVMQNYCFESHVNSVTCPISRRTSKEVVSGHRYARRHLDFNVSKNFVRKFNVFRNKNFNKTQ